MEVTEMVSLLFTLSARLIIVSKSFLIWHLFGIVKRNEPIEAEMINGSEIKIIISDLVDLISAV